jgi:hypothetical protein
LVVNRSEGLWLKLLERGESGPVEIQQDARELQNDIFDQRKRDPMVFGWVYSMWRTEDEETMHVGAEALVAEYTRVRGG